MSTLKSKSSIALITGIIVLLLLLPIWYFMLVPSIMASEIEKIDTTVTYEGTTKGELPQLLYGVEADEEIQITITAHLYVEEVQGDNVVVKADSKMTNRTATGEALSDFDQELVYVFNKFTRENDPNAQDADKPREGYDPLYPLHLKEGENFTTWFDALNTTGTLEFQESIVEEGVTLYRYSGSKTLTNAVFQELFTDCTLSLTRTVLVEPLSGFPAYTENETLDVKRERVGLPSRLLLHLTYKDTEESKDQGIADAKAAYEGVQLLELYLPTILGVVATILITGLAFNIRRLKRKMLPSESKSAKPSSK